MKERGLIVGGKDSYGIIITKVATIPICSDIVRLYVSGVRGYVGNQV